MKIENYKLKIVFFGTPIFVVPVLEALIEDFEVVGIVTTPDVKIGRKKILTGTPVKLAYQKNLGQKKKQGLIVTSQQFSSRSIDQLKSLKPDLFVVAAYGHLIPKELLTIPKYGSLNIHPSLLPKYRGSSPIQTAILSGDKKTGVTIIKMDEQIDHGPIVIKEELPISQHDTFETLHIKLFAFAAEMLQRIIPKYILGKLQPKPQEHKKAIYCDHITRDDGYFDIKHPPKKEKLDRMIRAYYPWPGAWFVWQRANGKEQRVKLLPEGEIQLEGGKPMSVKEFVNGYPELKTTIEKLMANGILDCGCYFDSLRDFWSNL